MNEINLAKVKRLLKKADKYENTVNYNGSTVDEVWANLEFIQTMRSDVVMVSQLDGIPTEQLIAECSNNSRKYVCLWLFTLNKNNQSLEFIKKQLYSQHNNLVRQSLVALQSIKSDSARKIVEEYCSQLNQDNTSWVDEYAREVLSGFAYEEIPDHVREQLKTDTELGLTALKNIADIEATNILLDYLESKENPLRWASIDGLEGRPEEDIYRRLIEYTNTGRAQTKLDALKLLSDCESDSVALAVCAIMKHGKSINIRKEAALSLGHINNDIAIQPLIETLQNRKEHPDIIARVCISLQKLNAVSAIPMIHKLISTKAFGKGEIKLFSNSNLYSLAVETLHKLCEKEQTDIFIELLSDKSLEVKLAAIHALRQRKSEETYIALSKHLQIEKDKICIAELEKSIKTLAKFKPATASA